MIRTRPACIKHLVLALVGLLIACSTGCLGPRGLSVSRKRYNEALVRTNAEEALLNFVRLRYLEQPLNLPVSGITSQFELNAGADLVTGRDFGDSTDLFSPTVSFSDRPTVTFNPVDSAEDSKIAFSPILPAELDLLLGSFNAERTFRIFVSQINRLDNASLGNGPTPAVPPRFEAFRQVAALVGYLQSQQAISFPVEQRQVDVEELTPVAKVNAQDLAQLNKAGYGIRRLEGDAELYQVTETDLVSTVRLHESPHTRPAIMEFKRLLRLKPNKNTFDFESVPQQCPLSYQEPCEEREDKVCITPRSVTQASFFLSQAVEVPPEHIAAGMVRLTYNPDGSLFDWGLVMEDLFRVHWCKRRPKNAFAAVRYRGYWFYIDSGDTASISTILLFNSALRLLSLPRGQVASGVPLLTLTVGN